MDFLPHNQVTFVRMRAMAGRVLKAIAIESAKNRDARMPITAVQFRPVGWAENVRANPRTSRPFLGFFASKRQGALSTWTGMRQKRLR
jgi:hypothetical protein